MDQPDVRHCEAYEPLTREACRDRNAARSLVQMVRLMRTGHYQAPDRDRVDPRQK